MVTGLGTLAWVALLLVMLVYVLGIFLTVTVTAASFRTDLGKHPCDSPATRQKGEKPGCRK